MAALVYNRLPTRRYTIGLGIGWEALRYFRYWIIAAVLVSFLGPLALSRNMAIDLSTWFFTANVGKWFTAFVGGGFVFALVPSTIAAGLTRRELAVAMGVFGAAWSALIGAVVFAAFSAERWYYGAMDWSHGVTMNGVTETIGSWGETLAFAGVYPLLYLAYFAAGIVIGAASYRWEGSGWLVLVPILPVLFSLDNALYNTEPVGPGWVGYFGRFIEDAGRGFILAAIVVVIAVLAYVGYRILLDIPLRSKKA